METKPLSYKTFKKSYGTFNIIDNNVKAKKSEDNATAKKSHLIYLILGYLLATIGSPVLVMTLLFFFFSCLTQDLCFKQDNFGTR